MSDLASTGTQVSQFVSNSTSTSRSQFLYLPCKPTGFHNLPARIFTKIFEHLDEKQLRNLSLVCKRWRRASLNPVLWKKLEVYGKEVPASFICQKIRQFKYLEVLVADNISDPLTVIRQICRCVPNIKHLAIRNCPTIPETTLRNLIQCCKQLQTLDFSGTRFRANRFYQEIAGLINLKSLNFSQNVFLSVRNLLSVVLNCNRLEELKVTTLCATEQLSDEDASFIIWNLAPTLKALVLDTSTLTNFSFKAIMNCNKLERLGLYGAANLTPDVFVEIWQHLPKLTILKVRHAHQVTGEHLVQLFTQGRETMRHLKVIDFSGCWKITDMGLDAIAACCENLQTLILKSCKNLNNLRQVRDCCNKLEKLNIAFCTNLDIDTILPLSTSLKVLVVDKFNQLNFLMKSEDFPDSNLAIKLCLSEFNKQMEIYK